MPYNILSCKGFTDSIESVGLNFGPCFNARIGFVMLFFIIAIVRKWGAEEFGIDYSFWLSLIAGFLSYFIAITISGNSKISFGIGLITAIAVGYGAGFFFGGTEDVYG